MAIAFDDLKICGLSDEDCSGKLRGDSHFDRKILKALATLKPNTSTTGLKAVRISDLATGMILKEEIRTNVGMLLVGRGQEVTYRPDCSPS